MNSHFNIWPATIKSYVFRNVSIHPTALFIEARSLRKRQTILRDSLSEREFPTQQQPSSAPSNYFLITVYLCVS